MKKSLILSLSRQVVYHSTLKQFKQNLKTHQQDLNIMKEHASGIADIFCMKS